MQDQPIPFRDKPGSERNSVSGTLGEALSNLNTKMRWADAVGQELKCPVGRGGSPHSLSTACCGDVKEGLGSLLQIKASLSSGSFESKTYEDIASLWYSSYTMDQPTVCTWGGLSMPARNFPSLTFPNIHPACTICPVPAFPSRFLHSTLPSLRQRAPTALAVRGTHGALALTGHSLCE